MYDRIINDTQHSFGVSGKLYDSNVLLYDHQTESLWSQLQEVPAIMNPRFIPASEATWLTDQDELIGIVEGDVARAYPLRILTWHEVVNDTIGEKSIAVTY